MAVPSKQWSWWVTKVDFIIFKRGENTFFWERNWLFILAVLGLEEEAKVPFHEHIFLEKHLEEGFPREGPVRHFMELVVTGLSRNPYLTVQQKKEHISWFRDYFHQKEEVLKEADVYLE